MGISLTINSPFLSLSVLVVKEIQGKFYHIRSPLLFWPGLTPSPPREKFFRSLSVGWGWGVPLCTHHTCQAKAANGSWGDMNVCGEDQCSLNKLSQREFL